jgi:hypothetical protein
MSRVATALARHVATITTITAPGSIPAAPRTTGWTKMM